MKYVNEFLNIGIGARALGMSGAVTANTTDGTSFYWNTAGMTEVDAPFQLNAMHSEWFGGIANYDYFGLTKRMDAKNKSYAGLAFIRLGVDNIPNTINLIGPDGSINYDRITNFSAADYAFMLSYATKALDEDRFSIGGNIKIIRRVIGSFGGAWGFGADIGIKYRINQNLILGVMGRDITTTFNAWSFNLDENTKQVFRDTNNEVPVSSTESSLPKIIFGVAYKREINQWELLLEGDLNISTDGRASSLFSGDGFILDPAFGMEVGYINKVFLRAGLGNIQRSINPANTSELRTSFQPSVGLGVLLGRLRVDYALSNVGNISGVLASHIFSLQLDFSESSGK